MADKTIDIKVKVNTETGQLEVLGKQFGEVKQKANALAGEANDLFKSFLPFATAGGILAFFTSAVKGANEENEAIRRLKTGMENLGISYDKNKIQIDQWVNAIQTQTRFSDTEAYGALDKLTRVTGSVTQAQGAAQLAMGLATSSGKSLGETMGIVTDLLNGNERSLIAVKREFGGVAGGATTTQQALDLLSKTYGNAAIQEESFTKSAAILSNEFGNFKDQIGNALIPSLTWLVEKLQLVFVWFDRLMTVVAANAAVMVTAFKGISEAWSAAMHFDAEGVKTAFTQMSEGVKTIVDASVINWENAEAQKTASTTLNTSEQERLIAKVNAAQREANNKTITDGREAYAKREADDRANATKTIQTQQDMSNKAAQIGASLNTKLAALGQNNYKQKIAVLNAEYLAERAKLEVELKDNVQKEAILAKLDQYHVERTAEVAKMDVATKRQMQKEIMDDSLQALQIINDLGDKGSEGERVRAIAILALQKAVAIGWAIVAAEKAAAETAGGIFATPVIAGLLAAQIALIGAQAAQGIQSINQAHNAAKSGSPTLSINTDLGNGTSLDQTFGQSLDLGAAPAIDTGFGSGSVAEGGGSSAGGGGTVSVAGGGGGGSGGLTVVQNIHVQVNLSPENLDLSERRAVLRALAEEIRGTASSEAVNFALAVNNLISKNSHLAV